MPGIGRTSASFVATNCRNSFSNLKLALVAGICGGVPFYNSRKTEIVLGDVIISEGLIAYDYGRQYPDRFVRKNSAPDVFGRPPPELRGLLGKLKGRFGQKRLRERTVTHLQTLKKEFGNEDGSSFGPAVHFGYIACGDQVMKSGQHRDVISGEEGVIAFEMEGAGP
ncbi:hypothetical protein CKAH01_10165 [Colletotrichum kahawae]|uniref:Nucleoside phosphorylase domain-containing protein n=1 Tax=Colletotrichum kahawae TaxID=34407 RepID=A0AAE0CXG2_COLKA|nr:hypothetical protein CKAH01_10165 [Colletotrichum kahawae]